MLVSEVPIFAQHKNSCTLRTGVFVIRIGEGTGVDAGCHPKSLDGKANFRIILF